MESPADAAFISVDVETAGPNPAQYSLLSLGACLVLDPANTFYVEVQPVTDAFVPEAMQITGLEMEKLRAHGLTPEQAMSQFADVPGVVETALALPWIKVYIDEPQAESED